tara:strand:- start:693 stop:914 length:222 start_codon:yes stop_codon:yes gene_type:complete
MPREVLLPIALVSTLIIGCTSESGRNGTPSLFDTKAEAEKAAIQFNCIGAHKMGDKWMPCAEHDIHASPHKHK